MAAPWNKYASAPGPWSKYAPPVDPVMDSLRTIPGHLRQGVAAIPGAIGDVPHMAANISDYLYGQSFGRLDNYIDHRSFEAKPPAQVDAEGQAAEDMLQEHYNPLGLPRIPKPWEVISTQKILNGIEPVTGKLYEPQTTAGKITGSIVSMAPAAAVGGGSIPQRIAQAVVPGVASEAVGEAFPDQPWARALAAIVASGGTALMSRKGVPEQITTQAMGRLDQATLYQAARLLLEARQQGIHLTWPEAIQQITNSGTRLSDLQRVVENSQGGGAFMKDFYSDRPAQVNAAAQNQFNAIAPNPMIPEVLGPRTQHAAEREIDATAAAINNRTRPLYQAAERQQLPANSPILQDPAYQEAVRQIRANPVIGPRAAHLADDSIGMVDMAQRIMRDRAQALKSNPQNLNTYEASLTREAHRQASNEARNASPEYDAAVQYQRQLREQYLNPMQEGPIGKIAATSDPGAQTQALFPAQPQAGSEAGVARAMRGIGRTDPEAAAGIVRQHLENTYNEATQRILSGENQFGGAKFASTVAGNPQQRANLAAAVRALNNGPARWRNVGRFLDILEAAGKRPAPNFMTTFNEQLAKDLQRGGRIGEAATIAMSPQKAMTFLSDKYKDWRLGRGTEQLARLFTQGNVRDFEQLLQIAPQTRAIANIARALLQANAGYNAAPAPPY